jgi:NitT/TauT family transport system substrate-binding protein
VLGLIVLLQALTLAVSGPATSPEYLPIWVASADGHFDRQGLKVTLRPTRSEVGAAEALAQGQADLVATSIEALLRFGVREGQSPRLLLGLTAAPPVALLADAARGARVRRVEDLAGLRVGITAPGVPEHVWLNILLTRAQLGPARVQVVSVGSGGLERALGSGDLQAAMVPDAVASALIADRRATLLADLRTPGAAERTLGARTVSAAVFVRADRRPGERELAAFTRAIVSAEARLAAGNAGGLASRLPRSVVGASEEFEARLQQARSLYLPEGRVSDEQLETTVTLLTDELPVRPRARLQLLPPGRASRRPHRGDRHTGGHEEPRREPEREPDHVRVRAGDRLHQLAIEVLDRIGPRLVEGRPGRDVLVDETVGVPRHHHPRDLRAGEDEASRTIDHRHAGEHVVRAAAQAAQHLDRVVLILRLAEDVPVEHHDRVSAEHDGVGMLGGHLAGLELGKPGHGRGEWARLELLDHVGGDDVELLHEPAEQLPPAR